MIFNINNQVSNQLKGSSEQPYTLPAEIGLHILNNLNATDLASCKLVCSYWNQLANDDQLRINKIIRDLVRIKEKFGDDLTLIGLKEWQQLGKIDEVPPLPKNIIEILNDDCPFWKGKKVYQTHVLALLPKTVNGNPLTSNYLGELVRNPKEGKKTGYTLFSKSIKDSYGDSPLEESSWVLMTKEVIPDSDKSRPEILKKAREVPGYRAPGHLEAAAVLLMANRNFEDEEKYLFGKLTCCLEEPIYGLMVVVGFLDRAGLDVNFLYACGRGQSGVAPLMKLKGD